MVWDTLQMMYGANFYFRNFWDLCLLLVPLNYKYKPKNWSEFLRVESTPSSGARGVPLWHLQCTFSFICLFWHQTGCFQPEHAFLQVRRLLFWHAAPSRLAAGHSRRPQKSHSVKGMPPPAVFLCHCLLNQQMFGSLNMTPILKLSGCWSCAISVIINRLYSCSCASGRSHWNVGPKFRTWTKSLTNIDIYWIKPSSRYDGEPFYMDPNKFSFNLNMEKAELKTQLQYNNTTTINLNLPKKTHAKSNF